jgi:hypothetical protein
MIQNIITLFIVFSALVYTIIGILSNIKMNKHSKCDGCAGCGLKQSIEQSKRT